MKNRLFALLLLYAALTSLLPPAPVLAQEIDPRLRAQNLLAQLSPEERVGQLFIVTFQGNNTDAKSDIYELIVNHHVGGVVLSAVNENFQDGENAALAAYSLNAALQQIKWDAAIAPAESAKPHTYIPLLLGVSQEGGGFPNDQILSGLTPLPDQMALGATWNASLAEQTGEVMGRELSALGFNLYLGLSLDVLANPNPALSADLGTRAFGGDPYWVSKMGSAYLRGLHNGSNQRLAVIAKHFPGRGEADRPPEEEISTVRRSLDELKQIDLAPFFAVTNALDASSQTDGLLVSHIRYQGLQGNIRATTRPISFDAQALNLILSLPELSAWHQNGGLMMSDNLGTAAVHRFYDPTNTSFSARLVARDAFLAGNDLLFAGNLSASETESASEALVRVLDYFTQKYNEDPAFAQRVDESALRVLTLKTRLYSAFNIQQVLPSQPKNLGSDSKVVFSTARQAASLISPSQADLQSILPEPPGSADYLVFFTDSRPVQQCSTCAVENLLPVDIFQKAVLTLYGPNAGALVLNSHLSSFTFDDLALFLNGQSPGPDLQNALSRASWVILSTLNLGEDQPQTQTLRQFLNQQQSLLLNKRVLLFSFSAPYYLDATDIANLTAYYGLFSDAPPFIDLAARLLFQEVSPAGSSPISVPGTGYDLTNVLSPSPSQVIPLALDLPQATLLPSDKALEPTPAPVYRVGDNLNLRTGIIYDHNNHPVPDGTVVQFILSQAESELTQILEATTLDGVARGSFRLNEAGTLSIRAISEPAALSAVIQLKVDNEGSTILIVTPTHPSLTQPAPTSVFTPQPSPQPKPLAKDDGYPSFLGWFTLQILLLGIALLGAWLATQFFGSRWGLRFGLILAFSGLAAYAYLTLELPGATAWVQNAGLAAFLQSILLAQGLGALLAWQWQKYTQGE